MQSSEDISYVDLGGKEWVFGEGTAVRPEVVSGMFGICRESDVSGRRIGRPAEEAGARASPGTWPQRLARGCNHKTNKKQVMLVGIPALGRPRQEDYQLTANLRL